MKPICVLLFDIDHFKNVNDTYGHGVGDEVLVEFSKRLTETLRTFDLPARLGGEEFVVVLPNVHRDVAFEIAYRLRRVISDKPFKVSAPEGEISVTTSIGGVIIEDHELDADHVIDRADKCLYEAKDSGRNCVYFEKLGLISQANVMSYNPNSQALRD